MPEPVPPYTVDTRVGRLIEARVYRLETAGDVDAYGRRLAEVVASIEGGTTVLCADHRPADIYPQAVTDRLVEMFGEMNSRIALVAIVTGEAKATLYMQLRRIAREAGNEARQVFQLSEPAIAHLAAVLTVDELDRAAEFLAEVTDG